MHQFIHISGFGHRARPGEARHATATGMIGEAARLPGSIAHLSDPRPANLLFGVGPDALFARLSHIRHCARDSAGRRLRSDAALIMIAVVSYPIPRAELSQPDAREDYEAWRAATMAWLRKKFGDRLATILEHDDELYCHLHAVLVPEITPSGQLDWSQVHPGRAAKAASASRSEPKATQGALYRRAMSQFQDQFHQDISARFGHARIGPKRERRERHHHLALRQSEAAAAELAKANATLRDQIAQLQRDLARIPPEAALPRSDGGMPSEPGWPVASDLGIGPTDDPEEDFGLEVYDVMIDREPDIDPDDDVDPEQRPEDGNFDDLDAFALDTEDLAYDDNPEPDETDTDGSEYAG